MSKLSKRLETLELIANPPGPVVVRVWMLGEDGLLRRHSPSGELLETVTQAQFDALPGKHIHITGKSEEMDL